MAQTAEITRSHPLAVERAGYSSWQEFLLREGEPLNRFNFNSAPVVPAAGAVNTTVAITSALPLIGKAAFVESITASANQACIAQIGIGGDTATRWPGITRQTVLSAGAQNEVACQMLVRGFQVQNGTVSLNVRRMLSAAPGTDEIYAAISVAGWAITDDFDFDAPITVLVIGDSILNGTGPSKTATMWAFRVKAYLLSLGIRARIVLKSVSGSTSADHETWRASGYHDIGKVDLIIDAVGVNDAGNAVADGPYIANKTAMWAWASKRYPGAKMLMCGPSPLENNTKETRAVGLRSALQSYVAGVSSSRLKYLNFGTAFDRTVTSNYVGTDTPGDRTHPNDTGHDSMFNVFAAAWSGFGWTDEFLAL